MDFPEIRDAVRSNVGAIARDLEEQLSVNMDHFPWRKVRQLHKALELLKTFAKGEEI